MTTKEEVIAAKNDVDEDINSFVSRLKRYAPEKRGANLDKINLSNIFEFFSYKEIDEIFRKDEEIRKCFEKAVESHKKYIDILKKWEIR